MNVAFIAHRFPAPLLTGTAFFRRYSHVIGGPAEYSANLFSQTYSRDWAGALAFTLLALATWAIARGILRHFSPEPCGWPAAAFPAMVLILASHYLRVVYILPMTTGLATAWLYMVLSARARSRWAQSAVGWVFLIASIPVYFLLGSGFLYLCAMCALFELLIRKRPLWGLAWIAFGAAAPYAMSFAYFEPDIAGRYLRWMTKPDFDVLTNGIVAAMYLFVPVGAVVAFLTARFNIGAGLKPRFRRAAQVAGFAVLLLLVLRLCTLHFDKSGWLYADYLLDEGKPEEALTSFAQERDDVEPIRYRTFFALARSGRLLWEMFHYPQTPSSDALLFRDPKWDTIPGVAERRSDVYLELGRVNDSQRWAHEALTSEGETPRLLERMALVYILNGNPDAARTFLRALQKVPFQAALAEQYLGELDQDPSMRADPLVARIRPLMLRDDYVGNWNTEQILQQCLQANPSNRMAFEYLLAHYLLTSDLEGFARLAPRLKDFYGELPTHVEEALLSFRNVNGSLPPGVDASAIDSQTNARSQRFLDVYLQHQDHVEAAERILAPTFGETYWYFYIFGRTSPAQPRQLRADASQRTEGPQ